MARTTIDLDPSVLRELRERGRREKKSMGQVASELLAGALRTSPPDAPEATFSWSSEDLGAPKVDLEDAEAVAAALEEHA